MEELVKITDLGYRYVNGKKAIENLNVTIDKGERIAVVGSNGAGKSTFFLCLNGVLRPQEGCISYRGTQITNKNLKDLRRHIGIVFQDPDHQMIASTVRAEVGFGPLNLGLNRAEAAERVEEALSYMDLLPFADQAPHYLSGGEKKRVGIADIIAMKPELIIFDEPAAALDPINSKMLERVLEQLHQEGKTLMISTHDMDFAYRWADRVLVFSQGNMIKDAQVHSVFMDNEVMVQANLQKPMLLQVYELLNSRGLTGERTDQGPRTVEELEKILPRRL